MERLDKHIIDNAVTYLATHPSLDRCDDFALALHAVFSPSAAEEWKILHSVVGLLRSYVAMEQIDAQLAQPKAEVTRVRPRRKRAAPRGHGDLFGGHAA
jgi:hypothetical protein